MTEDLAPPKAEAENPPERLSLTDLLRVRIAYERMTAGMYGHFIDKCRESNDPIVHTLDVSKLEQLPATLIEHIHLLAQALDVLGDKADDAQPEASFLAMADAARKQVDAPYPSILAPLQALLMVEQFNEIAWGLLLALMKDAELQPFVAPFEQACARHHEQRIAIQQSYEEVALGLIRRSHITRKSAQPLRSTLPGRTSMIFGQARHSGRSG